VHFPAITRTDGVGGMEIDAVELPTLPLAYVTLVIKSGSAADPQALPGLARLTAAMLKEGTKKRSSAALAEAVEFLGANLDVRHDEENLYVVASGLSEHFEQLLALVAEVALKPAFDEKELQKLKKRELARLALQNQNPQFLARRALYHALYGDHPYARIDTTPEAVKRVKRSDLARWHQQHVAPNHAVLVVAGALAPGRVDAAARRAFAGWQARKVPEAAYPAPPKLAERRVILVDRPASVQSVILIGNLAIERTHPDWIALAVANQVLGGSAAARLFMDLREKRSLTYGAYSSVGERVKVAPFVAYASVRNEVTAEAMRAFAEHLDRIVREPADPSELSDAKRLIVDGFPLDIDTPGKIGDRITTLRVFDLPDDYWDKFRPAIDAVTADEAYTAAARHIHSARSVIVVVGKAADVKPALEAYGPVTVLDTEGKVILSPVATAPPAAAAPAK
jgi:zinc protease